MTNIILAIDGALYGKQIEKFVLNHLWAPASNFKLLHVIEPIRGLEAWPEIVQHSANEIDVLAEIAAIIEKSFEQVVVSYEVREGSAKEEIIAEALAWPADMIVMGSHGRHGIQRFLLGSVSMSVIMQAPCSVALIRLPNNVQQESNESIAAMLAHKNEPALKS